WTLGSSLCFSFGNDVLRPAGMRPEGRLARIAVLRVAEMRQQFVFQPRQAYQALALDPESVAAERADDGLTVRELAVGPVVVEPGDHQRHSGRLQRSARRKLQCVGGGPLDVGPASLF